MVDDSPNPKVHLRFQLLAEFCCCGRRKGNFEQQGECPLQIHQSLPSNFTFIIKVLAYNRITSLSRCLQSLAKADYGQDHVDLHVFIDHFKELNPENQSEILNERIGESHKILEFVEQFSWTFGKKFVHYRTVNVGLQAQWLEAWWPSSDDEFAFVVEDDLEVSPLYYRFLRILISTYYYNPVNFSPSIYGASLQRPRFVAGKHGNKLELDSETRLFLYQMVGTWGQLLFPKPWKEFRLWYDTHKANGIKPILQGMVTTGWYKKMGERIWTPWFIKFIQSRGYFNIYTNFPQQRALSVSHRDAGVNYGRTVGPDSELLDETSLDFNLWEMQPLEGLKWYDFCFSEMIPNRVIRSLIEFESVLSTQSEQRTVLFITLFKTPEPIARNLLCHFERLNVQNYILVGTRSKFLLDLARRGHSVVETESLFDELIKLKFKRFEATNMGSIQEILVKAYCIGKSLELGYNSWLIDGNMVPVGEAFPQNPPYSFVDQDADVLYIRNPPTTMKLRVRQFVDKMAAMANKNSQFRDTTSFRFLAAKCLEEMGVMIKSVNDMKFVKKVEGSSFNHTALDSNKQMIFWPPEANEVTILKKLDAMGMWAIDSDLSCTAVVCHRL
ncbi:hypothetical protein H6P81_011978 [Aristolochia fimbriata]|uniref:Uncharacterized protein n=1 Tax=Aristolochia fimbriata TaxID=158543 RepID=A0AAV7EAH6_ARIFI|nr:hypothetical protein H6P81_011978 [Aristolochia fimbriata]